ncbi:FAD-dependent monooxygenase [Belnapia sp. T6]|uniref:FAD-dependent monooxygenase n=1 Tax=Belnapia mucosa TaxID=2804532 RepID=A0ABS1V1E1_9PROT|nr:FAD-dependent monooxygenase [Belnapia mucosa]MBL6454911.1 FAD-dependent monooxygenase [Belnapia mucosa]
MSEAQILIVGAGPTGLVLALALARLGQPFRIIDKAPGPGRASRAMAVQARTLELYRRLGIADAVLAGGIPVRAVHLREEGAEVAQFSLEDFGQGLSPYPFALAFPQDDHERLLVAALEGIGIRVEWNTELLGFTQDAAGVRARLRQGGADSECSAAWICGCDGAHSRVREALAPGFPGGTYPQRFYVADVRIAGPFQTDLTVNLAERGLTLMFPVRSSGMQRLLGLLPERLADQEDLRFEAIQPEVEALLGIRVEAVNWFSTYHVHHRVAAHFRSGRAFIAGDAGHIHSPAGGQGMNTGIGDALNLAWKLAAVQGGRAAPALLDSYEAERIGFARSLVRTTDRAFQAMTGSGGGSRFLRRWLVPRLLPLLTGFVPVRHAFFSTVSQIRIAYPESPLSEGEGGEVAAGDRMPWVPGAEYDRFDWRLEVHGALAPALADASQRLGLAAAAYPWGEAAQEAGLQRDAAYLVRPDGHVGLAWANQDPLYLEVYVARHGLAFR